MKKSNLIITIAVVFVLAVSSVGAILAASGVFAASSAPVQTTQGAIQFTAPTGIRWNEGNNVFEVFNAAGVSYICSDYWVSRTGDCTAKGTYANEATAKAAGFSQASPLKTYLIMNDITYTSAVANSSDYNAGFKTMAYNLGSATTGKDVGVVNGQGYTLKDFPVRSLAVLFSSVYGTIKDLIVDTGSVNTTLNSNYGTFCYSLYGNIINSVAKGNIVNSGTSNNMGGVVFCVEATGYMFGCVNNMNITTAGNGVGGLARAGRGTIVDSINHGSITSRAYSMGITGADAATLIIIGCTNYGNLKATVETGGSGAAGMCFLNSAVLTVTTFSCKNYGDIEVSSSTGVAAGILVYGTGVHHFDFTNNNYNYGKITAANHWDLYYGVD